LARSLSLHFGSPSGRVLIRYAYMSSFFKKLERSSKGERPAHTALCAARKVPRVTRKVLRAAQKIL
ncbi:hypothetical protein, partial [Treponema endosymbiont of Eucomonympha sp.]|uniref:hypothetical protein n=1 Tax=Treponema endosymbiont of Eucomonympha sp. TaxID=1580831 RepID=UPI001EE7584F